MIRRLASPAPRRPRTALLIGAVVGSVALGGCAAGQVAQTANQANSYGTTVTANGLAIRNAQVAFAASPQGAAIYPVGGSAPLEMYVVNQGTADDKLVSASSPVAASVQIGGQSDVPPGLAMIVGGGTGTGGQSAAGASQEPAAPRSGAPAATGAAANPASQAAPADTAAPSTGSPESREISPGAGDPGTASPRSVVPGAAPASDAARQPSDASPTGSSDASGEAPAAGLQPAPPLVSLDPGTRTAQVVLTGLRQDIKAGLLYEVDLTFARAGQVTLMLPVGDPKQPREPAEQGGG